MDIIPINFEYEGKEYSGHFKQVNGAASNSTFNLIINNYYQGQLFLTEHFGRQFKSQTGRFESLTQYFADYVTAYIQ